jgi:hypothetical protein
MSRFTKLLGLTCALAACGDNFHRDVDEPEPRAIRIEPADAKVSVINGAPVAQSFTAILLDDEGGERDVTDEATFSLRDARYGSVDHATVTVNGQGAGPTRVIARYGNLTSDAGLTVYVKQTIVDPDLDPGTPQRFDNAIEDAALVPTLSYPLEGSLLPPNLGQFDVHWRQPLANVFEIKIANTYIDIKRYTNGDDPSQPHWTVLEPAQWYPIASSREQLALEVSGMIAAQPTKKGRSPTRKVDVTNEDALGGIYYWTTSGLPGIWRYDMSKPSVAPKPYFADDQRPSTCMGCHTLSRDGSKIAMTFLENGVFRGTVFNVASRQPLIPFDGVTQPALNWEFATFNAQATKLVSVEGSQLHLRSVNGGALLAGPLPTAAGGMATHPEISPNNKRLVNVEFPSGSASRRVPQRQRLAGQLRLDRRAQLRRCHRHVRHAERPRRGRSGQPDRELLPVVLPRRGVDRVHPLDRPLVRPRDGADLGRQGRRHAAAGPARAREPRRQPHQLVGALGAVSADVRSGQREAVLPDVLVQARVRRADPGRRAAAGLDGAVLPGGRQARPGPVGPRVPPAVPERGHGQPHRAVDRDRRRPVAPT